MIGLSGIQTDNLMGTRITFLLCQCHLSHKPGVSVDKYIVNLHSTSKQNSLKLEVELRDGPLYF